MWNGNYLVVLEMIPLKKSLQTTQPLSRPNVPPAPQLPSSWFDLLKIYSTARCATSCMTNRKSTANPFD